MASATKGLRREIGPIGSAMLVLNGAIGAGIFALPATLYADFGAFSPYLFPLFGALVFLIAIPLGELASRFSGGGGPVAYAREAFGPFISFEVGWAYYVSRMAAFAANMTVFATYAATLWPPLGEGLPRALLILVVVAALTVANVIGVKRAVAALDILSILKIAPLLALAFAGIAQGAPAPAEPPPAEKIGPAALLILYAFVGFEAALVPAGETRNAERTIPAALLATLAATAGLYFFIQLGFASAMAGVEIGEKAPLVAMGERIFGTAGALVILAAALFSLAGNLMGIMIVGPRVTHALAERGALPRWFGAIDARFGTPANSVLFLGAGAAALALSGAFVVLAVVSTLARLFVYAVSLAALAIIEKKRGGERTKRLLPAPLMWICLALGLVFCLWAILQTKVEVWRVFGALILVGGGFYALSRRGTDSA
jgi:amino acid transporter